MQITTLHEWKLKPAEAIALQQRLAAQVDDSTPLDLSEVRLVAGVDVSVRNEVARAAVVVLTCPELEPVETALAELPVSFPYIPGLLSFREGPVLLEAFRRLEHTPDVFIFDGMGRIHPRRFGIASHMGLWLDRPTVGCGKSHLLGEYEMPGPDKGDHSPLHHRGELLGAVLRTRKNVKPVYISVGHRATLETALALALACTTRYRLPQPIRLAHNAAGQA